MRPRKKFFKPRKEQTNPRNEQIRVPYVMLVTDTGEKIDKIETAQALKMAYDKDLDLVLMTAKTEIPVAKIMDWGKFKYELTKKEQLNKKKQKTLETKEIRLRPKTDSHDLEIKLKKIKEFLEKGHKVKITMMFRGREVVYLDKGKGSMNKIMEDLKELAKPEDRMVYQYKRLSITLAPITKTKKEKD